MNGDLVMHTISLRPRETMYLGFRTTATNQRAVNMRAPVGERLIRRVGTQGWARDRQVEIILRPRP